MQSKTKEMAQSCTVVWQTQDVETEKYTLVMKCSVVWFSQRVSESSLLRTLHKPLCFTYCGRKKTQLSCKRLKVPNGGFIWGEPPLGCISFASLKQGLQQCSTCITCSPQCCPASPSLYVSPKETRLTRGFHSWLICLSGSYTSSKVNVESKKCTPLHHKSKNHPAGTRGGERSPTKHMIHFSQLACSPDKAFLCLFRNILPLCRSFPSLISW